MVGLYETALDELCAVTKDGNVIRPQVKLGKSLGRCRRQLGSFPLFLHRAPMYAKGSGESFDGREQALL
jgi:hypothetical protein